MSLEEIAPLRLTRVWVTSYRGVVIEVNHHGVSVFSPHGTWCGYLRLGSKWHPEILKLRGTSEIIQLMDFPVERCNPFWYETEGFEWNGDVTFYEEVTDAFGHILLKIGCDYAHFWDDERRHTLNEMAVLCDMKANVDAYRAVYPETKP